MKKVLVLSFILTLTALLEASELAVQNRFTAKQPVSAYQQRLNEAGSIVHFKILRTGPDQGLYLMGENHTLALLRGPYNKDILEELFAIFDRAETEEPQRQFHVLVESQVDYQGFKHEEVKQIYSLNILKQFVPRYRASSLKSTVIEDIENREPMGAIGEIWGLFPDQEVLDNPPDWFLKQCDLFKERTGYSFYEYTFGDILKEFDKAIAQAENLMIQWQDPDIRMEFNRGLEEAKEKLEPIRIFISSEGENKSLFSEDKDFTILYGDLLQKPGKLFSLGQTVFNYAQEQDTTINRQKMSILDKLDTFMRLATFNFFDLYLLHRVLQLQNDPNPVKKIAVVAGAGHTKKLEDCLKRLNRASHSYAPDKFHYSELAKVAMSLKDAEKIEQAKSLCALL